ncbi:MAG: tetratricopeptide repeat protein [Candidatus Eisenbacteria bacterium]|nr:tetratricopeptide repeat protein [Candidatus Eisenbacteria bacterium]
MTPGPGERTSDAARVERGFREALDRFPRSPKLLARLGKCFAVQGRVEEALECVLLSLEMDPGQPGLLLRAGDLFASVERFEEALRFYEHYQELRPRSPRGYARMGDCLFRQGYFWSAADAFSFALSRSPDSGWIRDRLEGVMRLCAAAEA